ncbi:MAG: hypothetical protein HY921_06340 [Elusimicrobia bacterium]|nr:hypothetical protein [Elusimicrobiota bacterium]
MTEKKFSLKELRVFGLVLGGLCAVAFWRWSLKGWRIAPGILGLGLASALAALARPAALEPVLRRWMKGAKVLARINTALVLGVMYYLVMTPVGLALRLFSGDPLEREWGSEPSYWKTRTSGEDLSSYERQF